MKTVIFCGGKGSRMGESANNIPKPLIPVGKKPMLEHIMDHYAKYGVKDFILCLGYLGEKIREHFSNNPSKYNIIMVDTGLDSNKAQRLLAVKHYLDEENFFVAYGDDLSNVDIKKLLDFHLKENKIATLTAVRVINPYGVLFLDEFEPTLISNFKEKPRMNDWISGGYFVFNKKIFNHIMDNEELEKEVFEKLVRDKHLAAYRHPGFWKTVNTSKDHLEMEEIFKKEHPIS